MQTGACLQAAWKKHLLFVGTETICLLCKSSVLLVGSSVAWFCRGHTGKGAAVDVWSSATCSFEEFSFSECHWQLIWHGTSYNLGLQETSFSLAGGRLKMWNTGLRSKLHLPYCLHVSFLCPLIEGTKAPVMDEARSFLSGKDKAQIPVWDTRVMGSSVEGTLSRCWPALLSLLKPFSSAHTVLCAIFWL